MIYLLFSVTNQLSRTQLTMFHTRVIFSNLSNSNNSQRAYATESLGALRASTSRAFSRKLREAAGGVGRPLSPGSSSCFQEAFSAADYMAQTGRNLDSN